MEEALNKMKPMFARLMTPRAMVVRMLEANGALGGSSVKVVSIDIDSLSLVWKEAWVGTDEDIQVGEQQSFRIANMGECANPAGTTFLNITKSDGVMLLQLQAEDADEVALWQRGLLVLKQLAGCTDAVEPDAELEKNNSLAQLLALRSNIDEIQQRIAEVQGENLEGEPEEEAEDGKQPFWEPEIPPSDNNTPCEERVAVQGDASQTNEAQQIQMLLRVNEQKEMTIQRLTHRLEHSLEMLKAVHEMYDQQKNVLLAQQRAIEELRRELAEKKEEDAQTESGGSQQARGMTRNGTAPPGGLGVQAGIPAGRGLFSPAVLTTPHPQPDKAQKEEDTGPMPEMFRALAARFGLGEDVINEETSGMAGDPEEDPEDAQGDLFQLLEQVEMLKNSIGGLEKMASFLEAGGSPKESPHNDSARGEIQEIYESPKSAGKVITRIPEENEQINEDGQDNNYDLNNFDPEQMPGELAGLGQNLRMLEKEKFEMQQQLRDAQNEQVEMVERLAEMKSMVERLGSLAGK